MVLFIAPPLTRARPLLSGLADIHKRSTLEFILNINDVHGLKILSADVFHGKSRKIVMTTDLKMLALKCGGKGKL